MVGQRTSTTAASDDSGVAAVIGVVLLLALATAVYAQVARDDVPRWGAEAEQTWDEAVQGSLRALSAGANKGVGQASAVSVVVPAAGDAQGFEVPLLGSLEPLPPTGSIGFQPACASLTARHATSSAGVQVNDLVNGSAGCVVFEASPVYSPGFSYVMELGGLLRVQSGGAAVLVGPVLELDTAPGQPHRVGLTVATLRGAATTSSTDNAGVRVDLAPGGHALDAPVEANAARVEWIIETAHPTAWQAWFGDAFQRAGVTASQFTLTCDLAACATGPEGTGRLTVVLLGPSADPDERDVELAVSHSTFDVTVR